MDDDKTQPDIEEQFKTRFAELPQQVQRAIESADVQKNLQLLSTKHKLHIDQWELLENEVRLVLYGFQPAEKLEENIARELEMPLESAQALANDIATTVFEPIRNELEQELKEQTQGTEKTPEERLAEIAASVATVLPATPPPPKPEGAVIRAPTSPLYTQASRSHERSAPDGDPYREQLL